MDLFNSHNKGIYMNEMDTFSDHFHPYFHECKIKSLRGYKKKNGYIKRK